MIAVAGRCPEYLEVMGAGYHSHRQLQRFRRWPIGPHRGFDFCDGLDIDPIMICRVVQRKSRRTRIHRDVVEICFDSGGAHHLGHLTVIGAPPGIVLLRMAFFARGGTDVARGSA